MSKDMHYLFVKRYSPPEKFCATEKPSKFAKHRRVGTELFWTAISLHQEEKSWLKKLCQSFF